MSKTLLRIGFDGSRAFASWRTGTENYSYQLLKSLAKLESGQTGVDIYSVFVRPGVEINKGYWPKNFKFIRINFPRLWTQVGLALKTFSQKMDLLFIPSHTLPIIRRPGLKTVVTVHDLGAEYLPKMHQLKQRLYLKWMTKMELKSATKIIAVSKSTKKDLIEKVGIDQKKIEVVYEGVDREVFKPIKNDILVNTLRYYHLQTNNYFLFVGTIQPRKNVERLIRAFAIFRGKYQESSIMGEEKNTKPLIHNTSSMSLILVGQKGWMSDSIYNLPKKLGIEDRVKFLGRVEDEKLVALYNGALALVYPSLFEGFGLPILEAFACRCPVLTSNISSMPEIAGDAAILVDPYSEDDIVKAMVRIQNPELRIKNIERGLKRVEDFSWEKCAKDTLKVFQEVFNG